jgi:hypothetical protein
MFCREKDRFFRDALIKNYIYILICMISSDKQIHGFLSKYDEQVFVRAIQLRKLLLSHLPNIIEQLDIPANMIGYCYGQKYAELICVLIPSKKGLKLGFNRGTALPDPDNLLEGKGKISRYVDIKSIEQIKSASLKKLLEHALAAYEQYKISAKK